MYWKIRKLLKKVVDKTKRLSEKPPRMKFFFGWYYKHTEVKENRILFESFHGKDLSDSPLYILMELLKTGEADKYEIYFATNNPDYHRKQAEALNLPVKLVSIEDYEYPKILATAKYLINNSSFPAYFIRKPEQVYLQTWHGTPLKTLGKRMRFGMESMYNVQHNFLQANYIMFPNEFTRDVMMEDYNLNHLFTGKVVMNGYPRNSIFSDHGRAEEVCRQLQNEDYTTLAYMPTWRGLSNHDIRSEDQGKEIDAMLKYLDDNMKDNQKLYVNFHPIVQGSVKLEGYKHIMPFPLEVDKYEFLNSVDALITDYSSVLFDYSVTRKPIILFMYDYDEYMHDRGMYFDIKELPFRKVYDVEALKECIVSESFREDDYADDQEYINKFIQYDSIDSGRKMMELVFKGDTGNMPVEDYSGNREREWNVVWVPGLNSPEAIDGVARMIDREKDIVVFERFRFNPSLSSYLHDNYRDDFVYLFLTKTLPRTVLEEITKRKSRKLQEKLHQREIRRCFMDLNVNPKFQSEFYHGGTDEKFRLEKETCMAVKFSVENSQAVIDYSPSKKKKPRKLLIIGKGSMIIWTRELTAEEKASCIVRESLQGAADRQELNKGGNYRFAFEVNDKNGKPTLNFICDMEHFKEAQPELSELNTLALRYPTLYIEDCYLKGMEQSARVALTPYTDGKNGQVYFHVCYEDAVENKFIKVQVKKISTKGSVLRMKLLMPDTEYVFKDIQLKYRNEVKNVVHSLTHTVREKDGILQIDVCADMKLLQLQPLYWDLNIIVEKDGCQSVLGCYTTRLQRLLFALGNYQCTAGENDIIFPYRKRLAFSYRARTPYDGWNTKIKEYAVLAVYVLLYPYWSHKRVWLVYEKFCIAAQENGYYFFKYCMENLPEEERRHIFYILDKESPDRGNVEKYGKQVLEFMSFRYMLYCLVARLYISPDSRKHLYIWRAKPNPISILIERRDILFLQHGVTALKRVHTLFGKNSSSRVTYFVTTSQCEQDIVVKYFGYTRDEAPILGFARWDVLEDTSRKDERMILVMPSWRAWLEENTPEEFKSSEYYQNYTNLLQSERLKKIMDENKVKLIFFIHPKLKDYLNEFHADRENVELIPFGSQPLNEIIKRCSMLITDYSSVCWDAYYLEKPVLFYQFDSENYIKAHGGSYLDFETELFGDRYIEGEALIDGIEEYVNNGFQEKKVYGDMRSYYFEYRDNDNSKRTYEYILEKGY